MGRALVNSPVEAKAAGVPTVYFVIKKLGGAFANGAMTIYYSDNITKWTELDSALRFNTKEDAIKFIESINKAHYKDQYLQIEEIWQTFSR